MGIASCHIQIHPRCSSILLRGWFLCNVLFWRNSSIAGGFLLQRKKPVERWFYRLFCGGDEGDRTPYLLNAIQALS